MKTTTELQGVKIITTYEGGELTEALLIGKSRMLDCSKRKNGNYVVILKKTDTLDWESDRLLRMYEFTSPTKFFTYWDKKLNEWKSKQ